MAKQVFCRSIKMTDESFFQECSAYDHGFWQAPYGMCIVSLKGEFLKVNKPMSNITGYSEKELLSSTVYDVTHPDDRGISTQNYHKALMASPKPFQCKKRYLRKDSNMIWILVNSIGITDKNGKVCCFLSRVQDVSDRLSYEEVLRHDNIRYEIALKYSNFALIDWDITSDKGFYTRHFHQKIGFDEKDFELTAEIFDELVHPLDRDIRKQALEATIANKKNYDLEYRIRHRQGHYIWVHARAHLISDDHGNPVRISGILEDISNRKKDELEITSYVEELEKVNKNMEAFAHVISHDLKEPLRGICNNLYFLEEELEPHDLSPYAIQKIGRMNFLCDRMESMIGALMSFVKFKSKNIRYMKTDLKEILDQIRIEIVSIKSSVKINIPSKLPDIPCDRDSMKELFTRLIQNGIEYNNSKDKEIEIGYKTIKDPKYKHLFYVKDNGIGIEKIFLENIFDMFKRIECNKSDNDQIGIGLTFAKKIVESHGGIIWIESEPGETTSVFFCLPG